MFLKRITKMKTIIQFNYRILLTLLLFCIQISCVSMTDGKFIEKCSTINYQKYLLEKSKVLKGKDFSYYYNKAWEYVKQEGEKSYSAIVHFEQAIKLYPSYGGLYNDLANCYRGGFKCYKEAERLYTESINKGFEEGFAFYNRAICRYENGDLAGMRIDLEEAQNRGWNNDHYKLKYK